MRREIFEILRSAQATEGGVKVNKIKMKDIAKELALSSKDMLHLLRELGIQVKSQMATLTDEEAAQLRARVRQGSSGRTQVIDTEVQPGVIVRRRKAAPPPRPTPRQPPGTSNPNRRLPPTNPWPRRPRPSRNMRSP